MLLLPLMVMVILLLRVLLLLFLLARSLAPLSSLQYRP